MRSSWCSRRLLLLAAVLYLTLPHTIAEDSWNGNLLMEPGLVDLNATEFLDLLTSDSYEYLQFVQAMANFEEKFSAFESDWRRIRNNFLIFYQQQRARQGQGSHHGRTAAPEIIDQPELRAKLTAALQSYNADDIARSSAQLLDISDVDLAEDIYMAAINRALRFKAAEVVARSIQLVHRVGDRKSLELMVRMQLYLYWKMVSRTSTNDSYLLRAAYSLSQIKRNDGYQHLTTQLRTVLELAVEALPETLRLVFFEQTFCLFNAGKQEYLYTPDRFGTNPIPKVRYMYTWIPTKGEMSQGAWITKFHESEDENATLKATLKSKSFETYMYLEHKVPNFDNLVAAWVGLGVPATSRWTLQFINNTLVLSQNSLVMCVGDRRHDNERRYVQAFSDDEHTSSHKVCQWIATHCPNAEFEVVRNLV